MTQFNINVIDYLDYDTKVTDKDSLVFTWGIKEFGYHEFLHRGYYKIMNREEPSRFTEDEEIHKFKEVYSSLEDFFDKLKDIEFVFPEIAAEINLKILLDDDFETMSSEEQVYLRFHLIINEHCSDRVTLKLKEGKLILDYINASFDTEEDPLPSILSDITRFKNLFTNKNQEDSWRIE